MSDTKRCRKDQHGIGSYLAISLALYGLENHKEFLREGGAGSNGTLLDTGYTIVPRCLFHQETVIMQRSSLFGAVDIIVELDFDHITPVGFNDGPGKLPVDENDILLISIRRSFSSLDSEVVVSCLARMWGLLVRIGIFGGARSPRIALRQRLHKKLAIIEARWTRYRGDIRC